MAAVLIAAFTNYRCDPQMKCEAEILFEAELL
jgi:hypothetical protein